MAKISTYGIDSVVAGNDLWIGSDADNGNATMNFTPDNLSLYYIKNGFVDPSRKGIIYTLKDYPTTDIKGVFNLPTASSGNIPLDSNLTEIIVSALDNNRTNQGALLNYFSSGHHVKIECVTSGTSTAQRQNLENYAIYTVSSVTALDANRAIITSGEAVYYSIRLAFETASNSSAFIGPNQTVVISSIAGTAGTATPNRILAAARTPSSTDGNVGDFFVDTSTTTWYGPKTGSGWDAGTSLIGADGAMGVHGTSLSVTANDSNPNEYRITITQTEYNENNNPRTTTIVDNVNVRGPRGDQGIAGSTFRVGAQPPTLSIGNVGDFYIETNAPHNLYGPKTATSWGSPIGQLQGGEGTVGPQGPAGPGYDNVLDAGENPTTNGHRYTFEGTNGATDVTIEVPQGPAGPRGPEGQAGVGTQGPPGNDGVGVSSITADSPNVGQATTVTVSYTDGDSDQFTIQAGQRGLQGDKGDTGDPGTPGLVTNDTVNINRGGNDTGTISGGQITLNLRDLSTPIPQAPDPRINGVTSMEFTNNVLEFDFTMTDAHGHFTYTITTVTSDNTDFTTRVDSGNAFAVFGTEVGVANIMVSASVDGHSTTVGPIPLRVEITAVPPPTPQFRAGVYPMQTGIPTAAEDLSGISTQYDFVNGTMVRFTDGPDISYAIVLIPTSLIDAQDFTDQTDQWEFTNRSGFAVEFLRDATDSFVQGTNTVLFFEITQNESLTLIDIS